MTLDSICEQLITYGTPDKVADELLKFRETVGDFGTLLYAGKDWKDRDLGRRSMVLLAGEGDAHGQCRDQVTATRSFNRLRIDRRAGAAGDDQRRAAEEEFVDAVVLRSPRRVP